MKDYLSTKIMYDEVNGHEVSTVKLGRLVSGGLYETCIFYRDGSSDVVGRYTTKDMAIMAHKGWVKSLKSVDNPD